MSRRRAADRGAEPFALLLTCEHGGNAVPAAYRPLFRGRARLLASHRGLDIGAGAAARDLGRRLDAPLIGAGVTRLLVDLNRSIGHPALFSHITARLPEEQRAALLAALYHPYRELVRRWIGAQLRCGRRVLHVSVHSFVPVLHGNRRRADVGLLYDPARQREARLCREWQAALSDRATAWTVRRNYPYRGTSDGQVVDLRRIFPAGRYLGVELELNQAALARSALRRTLLADLAATLPR